MPKIDINSFVKKKKDDLLYQATIKDNGFEKVKIDNITINSNPRKTFDKTLLLELAESIKQIGLLQPIIINEDFVLLAGERRLRACKLLGYDEIHAIKSPKNSDGVLIALTENIQREDLNILELGQAMYSLIDDHNWKQIDLASYLKKSKGYVSEVLGFYKEFKDNPELLKKFVMTNISLHGMRKVIKEKHSKKTVVPKKPNNLSFSFKWVLNSKTKEKLNNTEIQTIEKKLAQIDKIKNELLMIKDKAEKRK